MHITNLFLASLSSTRLDHRSGLAAYAFMQMLPKHLHEPNIGTNYPEYCKICGAEEIKLHLDLTGLNLQRFGFGSMISVKEPYEIQFFLKQHAALPEVVPTAVDFTIFNAIIDLLSHADADASPTDIAKQLRKVEGFKASVDQARYFLEILGFCSILETAEHKGYLTKYTNPGLAPSKSHSSNWAYPVDFWTGKDGINRDAFEFWFGGYDTLKLPKK